MQPPEARKIAIISLKAEPLSKHAFLQVKHAKHFSPVCLKGIQHALDQLQCQALDKLSLWLYVASPHSNKMRYVRLFGWHEDISNDMCRPMRA